MLRIHSWLAACAGVLTFACTALAQPQAAEDRYIAARDAAIARFTPERVPRIDKPVLDEEARARGELEKQMRTLAGAVSISGFETVKFNLTSLFSGDQDFGKLDGLLLEEEGGESQIIVTTRGLLARWLRTRDKSDKLNLEPEAAVRLERFYTQAMSTDAAILRYADLPLGADKTTYAMLAARTQDALPLEADEIIISAFRGDRFFLASAPLDPPLSVEACSKAREDSEQKIEQLASSELKPGTRNDQAMQRLIRMREQVEADFRRCFAERAPKEAAFAEAVKAGRELLARIPAR